MQTQFNKKETLQHNSVKEICSKKSKNLVELFQPSRPQELITKKDFFDSEKERQKK